MSTTACCMQGSPCDRHSCNSASMSAPPWGCSCLTRWVNSGSALLDQHSAVLVSSLCGAHERVAWVSCLHTVRALADCCQLGKISAWLPTPLRQQLLQTAICRYAFLGSCMGWQHSISCNQRYLTSALPCASQAQLNALCMSGSWSCSSCNHAHGVPPVVMIHWLGRKLGRAFRVQIELP